MPPSVPPSTSTKNTLVCSSDVGTTPLRDSRTNTTSTSRTVGNSNVSTKSTRDVTKYNPVLPTMNNCIETTNVISETPGYGPTGGNSSRRNTEIVRQTMLDGYAVATDPTRPNSSTNGGGNGEDVTRETTGTTENLPASTNPITSSTGGMDPLSGNPYYGSSGTMAGYGGGGMYYSPYSSYGYGMSNYPYYGGYNYNALTNPLNNGTGFGHPGITNLLFNFQSIVFSLGQTIQVRVDSVSCFFPSLLTTSWLDYEPYL